MKKEGEWLQVTIQTLHHSIAHYSGIDLSVCAVCSQVQKVKKEAERLQVTIQQLQMKNKNLRQEVEELEAQLEEAEVGHQGLIL